MTEFIMFPSGEATKKDKALFRKKLPGWQEAYMGRLIEEYIELLQSDSNPSERFWALEKRIKIDRRHPGVLLSWGRRGVAELLAHLVRAGVINFEDIEEFSDDVKAWVRAYSLSAPVYDDDIDTADDTASADC